MVLIIDRNSLKTALIRRTSYVVRTRGSVVDFNHFISATPLEPMPVSSLGDGAENVDMLIPLLSPGCVLSAADDIGADSSAFVVAPEPFSSLALFRALYKYFSFRAEIFFPSNRSHASFLEKIAISLRSSRASEFHVGDSAMERIDGGAITPLSRAFHYVSQSCSAIRPSVERNYPQLGKLPHVD